MVKGGGGALLREKVVASVSAREVIVVGEDKVVERLSRRFPLPVEVAPFALAVVRRALTKLGARPHLRVLESGVAYETDNHNNILDCRFDDGIADARALDAELHRIPGVVETGLFLGLAHVLVVGKDDGTVQVRERPA
jgi:ribose 5-phosphate isomerase A